MAHDHSHSHPPMDPGDARYKEVRKVTLVGSVVDFLLAVAKVIVGYIGQSQALIADGIHSFSDLVTDFMVLWAAKHASRDADEDHPYGHGRIETLMTVVLGVALILVGVGIAWDALRRLFDPELLLHPSWIVLVVAAASIISKEAIYHYTLAAARKFRSALLRANAWHSRSDAISSIVVFVGVLGSMAGLDYLDAIAAIGVALMIVKIGWDLGWHSVRELIDTALDTEQVEHIRKMISEVDGVVALHMLRTRKMGPDALVDVHIQVESLLSVSEGHQISEAVRQQLVQNIEDVADVTVHIDPEDDELATPCCQLPGRGQIMAGLQEAWRDVIEIDDIRKITLHYLDGRVHVDVQLPLTLAESVTRQAELTNKLRTAGLKLQDIESIQIGFYAQ